MDNLLGHHHLRRVQGNEEEDQRKDAKVRWTPGVLHQRERGFSSRSRRLVYRWFLLVYQITYALGIIGYTILLLLFTGLGLVFPGGPDVVMELGVILIFYGVYFGVMGRDCAELCVDYMAAGMTVSPFVVN